MRRLALAPILLLSLASCQGGGSDTPNAEPVLGVKKTDPVAAKEKSPGFLERGKSLGKQAIEEAKKTSNSALTLATSTLEEGLVLGETSLTEVRGASEAIVKASRGSIGSIQAGVNRLVGAVAAAPNISQRAKIERIFILMIPVIGPSKRYLDARDTYRRGREQHDDAKLALARRETLMACAEMGLDVGTLGLLGGGADLVATGADKVLGALKIGRAVNVLTGSDSDTLTSYLDSMLENDHLRAAVDASLSAGA